MLFERQNNVQACLCSEVVVNFFSLIACQNLINMITWQVFMLRVLLGETNAYFRNTL